MMNVFVLGLWLAIGECELQQDMTEFRFVSSKGMLAFEKERRIEYTSFAFKISLIK